MTRSLLGDFLLAAVLTAVAVLTTAAGFGAEQGSPSPVGATALTLVAGTGLALAVRRQWPYLTLVAATALVTAYLWLGYPFGLVFLPYTVAVYTVGRHRPLARSVPASVGSIAVLLSHLLVGDEGALGIAYGAAWAAVPLAIGVTVRARQEVAERARAETIRAHVDEERLRVAQEVHDIVGHGLAAIRMQAEVALHVLAKRPEQAETALAAISRTSGQALEELRATLAVVREHSGGSESDRSPALSLARLDELRQRMGDAGLRVQVETAGEPRSLPPPVDLTGYRIVQESLTNVLRHGGAEQASVTIRYRPDSVELLVSNQVLNAPSRGGGAGIAGMRERVDALDGTFSAGPTVDGRFEVRASLPTGAAE